jgi:hypothetical protein
MVAATTTISEQATSESVRIANIIFSGLVFFMSALALIVGTISFFNTSQDRVTARGLQWRLSRRISKPQELPMGCG